MKFFWREVDPERNLRVEIERGNIILTGGGTVLDRPL